jgi:putative methionine-R-sulfoxide reductase with GAF domain
MTVPSRQVTPSLLHVDSILHHLHGGDAMPEVCRFLVAEFSPYRWVAVFRIESGVLRLDGQAGEAPGELDRIPVGEGFLGAAAREGKALSSGPGTPRPNEDPGMAVPIRTAGVVEGLLTVRGRSPTIFDGSDARFLDQVAARLAPEMGVPRTRLL